MDWQSFYEKQSELDAHIMETQKMKEVSVIDDKILALLVEVGELANETRCFKFWSAKPSSEKSVILEEYVDGLHFILSLGLDLQFYYKEASLSLKKRETDAFLDIFTSIEHFKQEKSEASYQHLFRSYLELGNTLGFSEKDLQTAYQKKNEVNFQRQDEGY
ncbi:dUTP diphosphatase [Halobacillus campisalis]|uniref:dUTP diphosphatase n=1 Tax=Halobacillus campisalis TaxID=435909 RepID=A0ABW2K4Q2_9BACI|nr:dUTP diphosphatase [Halobacillus campisalis]